MDSQCSIWVNFKVEPAILAHLLINESIWIVIYVNLVKWVKLEKWQEEGVRHGISIRNNRLKYLLEVQ